jgi:hypothetical protein
MGTIGVLWLPILVSGIVLFIASALVWMVLPHHRNDYGKLPDEPGVLEALSKAKPAPGQYRFPYVRDPKEMGTPEFAEKLKGPVGVLTMMPSGPPTMNKALVLQFVHFLGISACVAYITGRTAPVGAPASYVLRVAGKAAVLAYVGALFPNSIWWGRPWSTTFKDAIDGFVYGLLTAGIFAWLWPR